MEPTQSTSGGADTGGASGRTGSGGKSRRPRSGLSRSGATSLPGDEPERPAGEGERGLSWPSRRRAADEEANQALSMKPPRVGRDGPARGEPFAPRTEQTELSSEEEQSSTRHQKREPHWLLFRVGRGEGRELERGRSPAQEGRGSDFLAGRERGGEGDALTHLFDVAHLESLRHITTDFTPFNASCPMRKIT